MARKSQRLRRAKRLASLQAKQAAQNQQPSAQTQPDNSVMQAKLKEEKVDVAPDTNFNPNIVEEMIKETEQLVSKVITLQEKKEETEPEGVTMAVQGEPIERTPKTTKKRTTRATMKKATTTPKKTTTTRKPRTRKTKA
tara:strand:- start:390 stop:806 length:417 start_codon:yes stop_codon:yes gene_type:complete